jgi:hypothetical protein
VGALARRLLTNVRPGKITNTPPPITVRASLPIQPGPQACEGKRLIMETDERHWQNLSTDLKGRLNPNNTVNQNITVQSR